MSRLTVALFATCIVCFASAGQEPTGQPTTTNIDLALGNGIVASYPESVDERFSEDGAQGYSLLLSSYVASGKGWRFGGRLGGWVSASDYGLSDWHAFSLYVGLGLSRASDPLNMAMEFGLGPMMASTTHERSNALFALGGSVSLRKYWMVSDSVAVGPGFHVLVPLAGQVSRGEPEWVLFSIGVTLFGRESAS